MEAAQQFRRAVEDGDVDAAVAALDPDVVFHSPVAHRPYHDRAALRTVLTAVLAVFEDFRYTAEYTADGGHVLVFQAVVDGRELQGVDILADSGPAGPREFTVMVRPYSAATALRDRMGALLA
jgi:hypothetical protein